MNHTDKTDDPNELGRILDELEADYGPVVAAIATLIVSANLVFAISSDLLADGE